MEKHSEIEKSIIKKFRKEIWSKFTKAINLYNLLEENDKIAVCISGGKDSMLLAKCMQELQRHGRIKFELKFIIMDPGYDIINLEIIKKNIKLLNIEANFFNSNIFSIIEDIKDTPCYLCARMRRGYLYSKAKELGCNKIALGHHYDDVIETILLSMFYGGEIKTMMPKLHSNNFDNMELIRPMYLIKESSIISWEIYNNLTFIDCACKFTKLCSVEKSAKKSKRNEMKKLIKYFREHNTVIEQNVFKSVENVNINSIIGYKKDGNKYNFLNYYNMRNKEDKD